MFGFFKKKEYPIMDLVKKTFGDDDFMFENKENDREFVNIAFLALTVSYRQISKLFGEKKLKKFTKKTNSEILAFEYSMFTTNQALNILEFKFDDAGEDCEYYDDLVKAQKFILSMYEEHFEGVEILYKDRVNGYSEGRKTATQTFSFNLCCLSGLQEFAEVKNKVNLDLELQMSLLPHAIAYRDAMVPAFIESVERLYEL